MRPSSTVTVRLQVSGQSRVQTPARSRSVMIGSVTGQGYSAGPGGSVKEPVCVQRSDQSAGGRFSPCCPPDRVLKSTFILSSGLGRGGREIILGFWVAKNHLFPRGDRPLGEGSRRVP